MNLARRRILAELSRHLVLSASKGTIFDRYLDLRNRETIQDLPDMTLVILLHQSRQARKTGPFSCEFCSR
jgi:hypothetical protein